MEPSILQKNEAIAAMLGYTYKTDVVWYESGYDYTGGYENYTIYSNKPPILEELSGYKNHFDSFDQPKDFKHISFMHYHDHYGAQFEVLAFIRNLKWNFSISNEEVAIFNNDYKFSGQGTIVITKEKTLQLSIFEALYLFSKYYNTINNGKEEKQNQKA